MGNCMQGQFKGHFIHEELGELQKIYNASQKKHYLKSNVELSSMQQYRRWSSDNKKMKLNRETKDFLYMPLKQVLLQPGFFDGKLTVDALFEPYIQTLQDLVQRYKKNKYVPTEELLWYLMYILVKVGKFFQKIEKKVGNIKPSNILISFNQEIKMVWSKSVLNFLDPVDQVCYRIKGNNLLAPEQLGFVDRTEQRLCNQLNPQISEVYTMGILILSVANLMQPHTLYNYSTFSFQDQSSINHQKIANLLQNCRNNKLSDLLVQTIEEMLEQDPKKRVTSSQLYKRLSQYQNEILSKKGLKYTNQDFQQVKQSGVGSNSMNISNSIYNSFFSANKTILNSKNISIRVSQMSVSLGDKKDNKQDSAQGDSLLNFKFGTKNNDFVNIL